MLFNHEGQFFRSEKERNLYGKFFAGYFFNELVPGVKKRVKRFEELLPKRIINGEGYNFKIELDPTNMHVSFDNHSFHLLEKDADRGEFADVLIHDRTHKLLIAIEVKYLTNWEIEKDIKKNRQRLKEVANALKVENMVHCLLITQTKEENCLKRSDSHLNRVKNEYKEYPVILLKWEDLVNICEKDEYEKKDTIIGYMNEMLDKKKPEDLYQQLRRGI